MSGQMGGHDGFSRVTSSIASGSDRYEVHRAKGMMMKEIAIPRFRSISIFISHRRHHGRSRLARVVALTMKLEARSSNLESCISTALRPPHSHWRMLIITCTRQRPDDRRDRAQLNLQPSSSRSVHLDSLFVAFQGVPIIPCPSTAVTSSIGKTIPGLF